MTGRKCFNCNYWTQRPIVDDALIGKRNLKLEIVHSEYCPVCLNLIYGVSKELK